MKSIRVKSRGLFLATFIFCFLCSEIAEAMVVFVNHAVYRSQENTAYVEIYLKIPVNTIHLAANNEGKYQASLNISLTFTKQDSVFFFNIYNLLSPGFGDTNNLNFALTDLKRIELPPGHYNMLMQITDNNSKGNECSFNTLIKAVFTSNMISFSDIQFADTIYMSSVQTIFSRNNYEIIPNVFNSYSSLQHTVYFYSEFYEADQFVFSENLFVKYYLKKDTLVIPSSLRTVKLPVSNTNYILGNIKIEDLSDGEYELVIEVYSPQNIRLKSKTAFFKKQRYSGISDTYTPDNKELFAALIKSYSMEQLKGYLSYLTNLADHKELARIELFKNEEDINELSIFFYNFWIKRDEKPLNAWIDYLQRIEQCNNMFSTMMRKGYLTDRGRIYLEYGPPNHVVENTSGMLTYPYQIWHYNKLTETQMNKKFVFFNRTGALEEYELIHSDATGEVGNDKWKDIISKYNKLDPRNFDNFGNYLENDFGE